MRAHREEHKGALRSLSDFIFEHQQKFTEQEYVQASNACKRLHELGDQMARGAGAGANTRDRMSAQSPSSPSGDEDDGLTAAELYVREVEVGERSLESLVSILNEEGAPGESKMAASTAIRDLVSHAPDEDSMDRQTALGATGAIQALVEWLDTDGSPVNALLAHQALMTLGVLIRRHLGNKTLLGASGAFPAITRHMRYGSVHIENLAISLLSDAGFQHEENQWHMLSAGTVDAIVHLINQVRPLDRIERLLNLLQQILCTGENRCSILALQAANAGIVPILLAKLGSSIRGVALDTLYKVYDDSVELRDQVVSQGGIEKIAAVLVDPDCTLDHRSCAARALGELGSKSFPNRAKMRELGVIAYLKELEREPSGRRRSAFSFALSRLDEEADGIAALEVKRKKQQEERAEAAKARAERRAKMQEEGGAPFHLPRAPPALPAPKGIAKKRVRK